jgi:organic radical activating enzyme
MFGTNEITSQFLNTAGDLLVNDLFYTIQGEGPDAGCPAIFLRLSKCNLRCFFCDTEFEKGELMSLEVLKGKLVDLAAKHLQCQLLVITGGEPLLQNIMPLVGFANDTLLMRVAIETAGTSWVPNMEARFHPYQNPMRNKIIVSPKTPKLHPKIIDYMAALKYIINVGDIDPDDGLPIKSTQIKDADARLYRWGGSVHRPWQAPDIYVQAMDVGDESKSLANLLFTSTIAMKHGYRLSVQLHKLCQLP